METPIPEPAQAADEATQRVPEPSGAEFEFGDRENAVFLGLSAKMNFVGLFTVAVGIFIILLGILSDHHEPIIPGALYALIGIWTQRASGSFRNIAATRGQDVSHLMLALQDLTKPYSVLFWICCLSLVGSLVAAFFLLRP
jgi:glycerol uptake facilitator-like aquaporin